MGYNVFSEGFASDEGSGGENGVGRRALSGRGAPVVYKISFRLTFRSRYKEGVHAHPLIKTWPGRDLPTGNNLRVTASQTREVGSSKEATNIREFSLTATS